MIADKMTALQAKKVKALAERFGSDLEHTRVDFNNFGLPSGWVVATVYPVGWYEAARPKIVAGIDPDGCAHT